MKNLQFTDNNIAAMLDENDQLCVSVIVPTHLSTFQNTEDFVALNNALTEAKKHLRAAHPKEAETLITALDAILDHEIFTVKGMGIGIYVSAHMSKLVYFTGPVTQKVIIGQGFELRDILYEQQLSAPYCYLMLTHNSARLFSGTMHHLTEVNDGIFPIKYTDDHEYEHPMRESGSHGNAFTRSSEKDKSVIAAIRENAFVQHVDSLLEPYLTGGKMLVVSSLSKELAAFKNESRHSSAIAALIERDLAYNSPNELEQKVWERMYTCIENNVAKHIADYKEKIGAGLGVEGIEEVWQAARQGRGALLLVEKDYKKTGFIAKEDDTVLHLVPPHTAHEILPDAIEKTIALVLQKNGKIIFTENDALADCQRIALITRY